MAIGVLFAGLAVGAMIVLRRFLPELFEGSRDEGDVPFAQAQEEGLPGARVNIVLPGETRLPGETGSDNGDASPMEPVDGKAEEGVGGLPESLLPRDRVDSGILDREVEDIRGESILPPEDNVHRQSGEVKPSVGLDDLDVLPDLDSMSDSFATAAPGSNDGPVFDPSSGGGKVDGMDTATLAKAVQTLIKRDSKG